MKNALHFIKNSSLTIRFRPGFNDILLRLFVATFLSLSATTNTMTYVTELVMIKSLTHDLQKVHQPCRGHFVLSETVSCPSSPSPGPIYQTNAMQQFQITSAGKPFWDRHCEIKLVDFPWKGIVKNINHRQFTNKCWHTVEYLCLFSISMCSCSQIDALFNFVTLGNCKRIRPDGRPTWNQLLVEDNVCC